MVLAGCTVKPKTCDPLNELLSKKIQQIYGRFTGPSKYLTGAPDLTGLVLRFRVRVRVRVRRGPVTSGEGPVRSGEVFQWTIFSRHLRFTREASRLGYYYSSKIKL